jgi:hypothetical protein
MTKKINSQMNALRKELDNSPEFQKLSENKKSLTIINELSKLSDELSDDCKKNK